MGWTSMLVVVEMEVDVGWTSVLVVVKIGTIVVVGEVDVG